MEPPKLHALGYIRQSRASEAAASPEAQRQAIANYCQAQGWQLVDIFADIGRSGFDPRATRPGLAALMAECERGGVQRVLVYKLDRLTRRGIVEALDITQRIETAGAALVSVTEPLDTSSALGQGIFALLLSLAKAESEKLSERVRGGKNVSRARKGWQGGPVPYGFKPERVTCAGYAQSRLVLDDDRAPLVRHMVSEALKGVPVRGIARELNAQGHQPPRGQRWTHASVLGLLRSPVLAGWLPDNAGDVLRGDDGEPVSCGEPMLSATEWRELQRVLEPRKGRKPQTPSLLGGLLRCSGCGGTMGGDSGSTSPSYRCCNAATDKPCTAPARVPMRDTDATVLAVAAWSLSHPEVSTEAQRVIGRWWALRSGNGGTLAALTAELDEVAARRERLRSMRADGDYDDNPEQYRKLMDATQLRHAELTERLDVLNSSPIPPELMQPGALDRMDVGTQRALLGALLVAHAHKAPRPGVRFDPVARLSMELVTGEDLGMALRFWVKTRRARAS